VPLEGEPENCLDEMKNGIPYRAIEPVERMEGILNGKDRNARVLWGYEGGNGMNINIDRLVFRNLDSWSAINRNDPQERNYYCPDFQCRFNGSLTTVTNINTTKMEAGMDVGYVDRVGNRVDGCAAYSLDCAPYIKENWPGGRMVYAQSAQFPNLHPQDKSVYFEADQSPAQLSTGNEWWLVPTDHEPRP
jgi:hypothetical protein